MMEAPKKKTSFREAAKRLSEIAKRPLDPKAVERINDHMEKSEKEIQEGDGSKRDRKIAHGTDIEGAL